MRRLLAPLAMLVAAGCATPPPSGPSIMVLPGSGKSFEQFRYDDHECRQYATAQTGGATTQQAANDSAVKSAAVGTAIGAAAGGLMGGSSGAGAGAGMGLAVGALAGTDAANASAYSLQRRYDIAYEQCMYAKGNQVPMAANRYGLRRAPAAAVPPPPPPGFRPG